MASGNYGFDGFECTVIQNHNRGNANVTHVSNIDAADQLNLSWQPVFADNKFR
jgi:hypothetical protein